MSSLAYKNSYVTYFLKYISYIQIQTFFSTILTKYMSNMDSDSTKTSSRPYNVFIKFEYNYACKLLLNTYQGSQ